MTGNETALLRYRRHAAVVFRVFFSLLPLFIFFLRGSLHLLSLQRVVLLTAVTGRKFCRWRAVSPPGNKAERGGGGAGARRAAGDGQWS